MIIKAIMKNYVIFNTVAGISVMGIILSEANDSFIVGLPARLIRDKDSGLKAEPYVPTDTSRFFKSTLLNYIELVGEFEFPYLIYVFENFSKLELPEAELDVLKARLDEIAASVEDRNLELPSHIDYIFPEPEIMH